jgi:tetratricopeptide (TPR) repeat protein
VSGARKLGDGIGRIGAATQNAQEPAGAYGGQHAVMNRKQRRAETPREGPPIQPASPTVQAVFATALQYHQAGRLDDAELLYRQVLAVNPRHADSLHLSGLVANQKGHHDVAVDLIGKAIAINGSEAIYHSNLGTALWKQGGLGQAVASYRRALELKPDYAAAHFNLATVLWKQGRLEEADVCFRSALYFKPEYPEAYDNLGTVRKQRGLSDEAISCYRRAIAFRPNYPEAHNNLGTALLERGQLKDAVACYRTALELKPDYAEANFNLGTAIWEAGQPDAAIEWYQTAIAVRPDYVDAYHNMGSALRDLQRLDAAVACYRKVLELEPNHPEAHSNLGIALLAQGNLTEGWAEHEWRWQTPQMRKARRGFAQPQWRGEPAEGQTLLIHAEQGFGDTLQFCRYAPLAAARGLRVIMEVQKPLVRLLRGMAGVDLVAGRGEALPTFDVHCPVLSLPLALETDAMASIPGGAPYLHANAAQAASWATRLAGMAGDGPRVGLAWAGDPRDHSRSLAAVDRRRSMTQDRLAPLVQLSGVRFFSLQKDGPAEPENFPITDFMGEMEDFADTAALVANLDLVISVDTAIVHLAAALGKPVWLLDRFDACWRWFNDRRDSPWYPTLRIYRQPRPGAWDAVLAEVARDLRRLAIARQRIAV